MADVVKGRKDYSDGTYYEGEMVNGKPNGKGAYHGSGFTYTGDFIGGAYNGYGSIRYDPAANLPVYDNGEYDMAEYSSGNWVNNKREGRFIHVFRGVTYDQCYKDDKLCYDLFYDLPAGAPLTGSDTFKCYHCGQSGFIIETKEATLVFDWYRNNLPPLNPDKPVYIFISHIHLDHYYRGITKLMEKYNVPEIYMGFDRVMTPVALSEEVEDIASVFNGEQYLVTDFGWVRTLKSTDLGVAFIVRIGDKTVFHAGDLFWNAQKTFSNFKAERKKVMPGSYGSDPSVDAKYRKDYENLVDTKESQFKKFAEPLSQIDKIDYAMIPMDPRWYDYGLKTVDHYLGLTDIRNFTPMHLWGKPEYVCEYYRHNPDAALKMIAINEWSLPIKQNIELNKPYFIRFN